jgi:hypothetical protein
MFTTARHWSLFWAIWTQSTPSHPFSLRSILILSPHLHLGLPSSSSLQVFPAKILHAILISPMRATFPAHLILLDLVLKHFCGSWTIGVLGFDSRRGPGIFLFTTASRTALGPTQPPIQWVPGTLSLGVKGPGREGDHSPPSSAEVNAWSYTSTPPICLHGVVLSWAQSLVKSIMVCTHFRTYCMVRCWN